VTRPRPAPEPDMLSVDDIPRVSCQQQRREFRCAACYAFAKTPRFITRHAKRRRRRCSSRRCACGSAAGRQRGGRAAAGGRRSRRRYARQRRAVRERRRQAGRWRHSAGDSRQEWRRQQQAEQGAGAGGSRGAQRSSSVERGAQQRTVWRAVAGGGAQAEPTVHPAPATLPSTHRSPLLLSAEKRCRRRGKPAGSHARPPRVACAEAVAAVAERPVPACGRRSRCAVVPAAARRCCQSSRARHARRAARKRLGEARRSAASFFSASAWRACAVFRPAGAG